MTVFGLAVLAVVAVELRWLIQSYKYMPAIELQGLGGRNTDHRFLFP